MFIAMNRFQVTAGREADFEGVWSTRETHLDQVPGFEEFHLLRGETEDEITTYVSHSRWASREAFEAWTKSEAFRKSHAGAGSSRGVIAGHPVFEGYEAVI
jgi:heme-degrading monooxygenase HmoA